MFEAIAKRKLQKDVAQLVAEKGAAWCVQYQLVRTELLQKHPNQQANIETLCHVIAAGAFVYILSLREPTDEGTLTKVIERIQQHGVNEEEATWAVQCWAKALDARPYGQRVKTVAEIKAKAEAIKEERRVAKALEEENRRVEAEQQRKAEVKAKRKQHLIKCWRLVYHREAHAIDELAKLVVIARAEAAGRAEAAKLEDADMYRLGGVVMSDDESVSDDELVSDDTAERIIRKKVNEAINGSDIIRLQADAEIWRRISTSSEPESLQERLEVAGQREVESQNGPHPVWWSGS